MKLSVNKYNLAPIPKYDLTKKEAFKLLEKDFNNPKLIEKGLQIIKEKEFISPKVSTLSNKNLGT